MIDRKRASVLCECGRHYRPEYTASGLTLETEVVCISEATDTHVRYKAGRQCGVLTLRLPFTLTVWVLNTWRLLTQKPLIRSY